MRRLKRRSTRGAVDPHALKICRRDPESFEDRNPEVVVSAALEVQVLPGLVESQALTAEQHERHWGMVVQGLGHLGQVWDDRILEDAPSIMFTVSVSTSVLMKSPSTIKD